MIRFVLRWSVRALALGLVVVIGLVLIRDRLLQEYLRQRIGILTGLETRIGRVETSLSDATLDIRELEVVNSPEFGGTPLLRVPELRITLAPEALRHGELRLPEVRVHLAAFDVVRNARGETNLFRVADRIQHRAGPADAAIVSPPGLEFAGIGTLDLTVGTVRFLDLGSPEKNRSFVVGLTNEPVKEVRSAADLHPLVFRVLLRELGNQLGGGFRIGTETTTPVAPP